MNYPEHVTLVEVGPRDGLQNEPQPLAPETRIALIQQLADAGLAVIEAGSFVSPRWVPQMADTDVVLEGISGIARGRLPVLVPNEKGLDAALAAGAEAIAVFIAATDEFNQKNLNSSTDDCLEQLALVTKRAIDEDIPVRAYISCVVGCPYAGLVAPSQVHDLARQLHDLGCYEISLGDTIGIGTPKQIRLLLDELGQSLLMQSLAVHFHDTYGQALANIFQALQYGVSVIDCAVAGLGGCPYAQGASGNVATEDVLYMLNGLGIKTGVQMDKLLIASRYICEHLGREPMAKVARALQGE